MYIFTKTSQFLIFLKAYGNNIKIITTAKIEPENIPTLRLSSKQLETYPIKVGPLVQPISPASANKANSGVPPLGIFL